MKNGDPFRDAFYVVLGVGMVWGALVMILALAAIAAVFKWLT